MNKENQPFNFKIILKYMMIPFVGIIAFFTFKFLYFGYLIPNSAAAKRPSDYSSAIFVGLQDVKEFYTTAGMLAIGFCMVAVIGYSFLNGTFFSNFKKNVKVIPFLFLMLMLTLFYIYAGGDWMPAWRYLSHTYVLVIIIFFVILKNLNFPFKVKATHVLFIVISLLNIYVGLFHSQGLQRVREWSSGGNHFEKLGRSSYHIFNGHPDILMAVQGAGALPFYSKLRTIDELGLTDEHIARKGKKIPLYGQRIQGHLASDYTYVFSRGPDILLQGGGQKGFANKEYYFVKINDKKYELEYYIYVKSSRWDYIVENFLNKLTDVEYEIRPFEADEPKT